MANLTAADLDAEARTLGPEQLWMLGYMEGYAAGDNLTITHAMLTAMRALPLGLAYTAAGRARVKAVMDSFD